MWVCLSSDGGLVVVGVSRGLWGCQVTRPFLPVQLPHERILLLSDEGVVLWKEVVCFWADLFIWWDIVLTRNNWPVSSETLGALFGCEPVPSLGLLSNESNRRIQYIKIFPSTCESPLREVSGLDVSQIQYWPKWPFHHRSFYHHICWKHDVITSSHPFCNP